MNPFSAVIARARQNSSLPGVYKQQGGARGLPPCSLSGLCLKLPAKDHHDIVPVTTSARNTCAPDIQVFLHTSRDLFRIIMVPMHSNAQPALDPIAYMGAG